MPKLKGSGWIVNFEYLKKTYGQDAVERVIATLDGADREELKKPIIPASWGPDFTVFMRFILAADKLLGQGDMALLPKAAAYHFQRDTAFYAVFFKIMTPEFMLKNIPKIWRQYFNPPGSTDVIIVSPRHAQFTIHDFPGMPVHHERYHGVYLEEILKRSNCKNIMITHPKCIGRKDPYCIIEAKWS